MSNLVNCPHCQSTVSALARSCPHCGAPLAAMALDKKLEKPVGILLSLSFTLLGLLVGLIASVFLGLAYNVVAGVLGFCIPFFGFIMLGRSLAKKRKSQN